MDRNRGFTLIEVLIALMIITTIIGVVIRICMEIIHIKGQMAVDYEMMKIAQGIIEDIKTAVIIPDEQKEEFFPIEMEKTLSFFRDDYHSDVLIIRVYPDIEFYEVRVRVKDAIRDRECTLYTRIYGGSEENVYDEIHYELAI